MTDDDISGTHGQFCLTHGLSFNTIASSNEHFTSKCVLVPASFGANAEIPVLADTPGDQLQDMLPFRQAGMFYLNTDNRPRHINVRAEYTGSPATPWGYELRLLVRPNPGSAIGEYALADDRNNCLPANEDPLPSRVVGFDRAIPSGYAYQVVVACATISGSGTAPSAAITQWRETAPEWTNQTANREADVIYQNTGDETLQIGIHIRNTGHATDDGHANVQLVTSPNSDLSSPTNIAEVDEDVAATDTFEHDMTFVAGIAPGAYYGLLPVWTGAGGLGETEVTSWLEGA